MPKTTVNDWDATAANNTDIGGISLAEGWSAANVNNAIRELMAQVAAVVAKTVQLDGLDVADFSADAADIPAVSYTNLTPTGYVTVGSPTGGQQGTGTVNATALYDDGVKLHSTFPWSLTIPWEQGAVVENGDVTFTAYAPFSGTITGLKYKTGNGSFSANVKIAGTSVTNLSAVAVSSSTYATTAASGANTFAAGDAITVTISSATSNPTDAVLALYGTRAAA